MSPALASGVLVGLVCGAVFGWWLRNLILTARARAHAHLRRHALGYVFAPVVAVALLVLYVVGTVTA